MTEQSTYDIEPKEADGLICYTDGGSRPNGSFMGWGFHGYTYKDEKPKKGSGIPTHYPSGFGYVLKSEKNDEKTPEVKPLVYIDGYGSRTEHGTNNLAELLAANLATSKALDFNVKKILLRTDSEYIRNGVENWSHGWIRNNWMKADGTPVPHQSKWLSLLKNIETIRSKDIKFNIEWVKAHTDKDPTRPEVLGNTIADRLATVGVMGSINGETKEHVTIKPADGYWKSNIDKSPFFNHKSLYFNTLDVNSTPGEYYIGTHGKDEDMLGKKMSDGAYAVIQLKEEEPIIELIRDHQKFLSGANDAIVILRLDSLFKQTTYEYIENYGRNAVVKRKADRIDLCTLNKEPLTRELKPPKLAMRAIDALSTLKAILLNYKTKQTDTYILSDITDLFYQKTTVPKGKTAVTKTSLKNEWGSGVSMATTNVDVDGKDVKVVLTFGIDIPHRNNLKGMESEDVKVTLVVKRDAPTVLRYYTIVESNGDIGIWAGFYSNMIFLK